MGMILGLPAARGMVVAQQFPCHPHTQHFQETGGSLRIKKAVKIHKQQVKKVNSKHRPGRATSIFPLNWNVVGLVFALLAILNLFSPFGLGLFWFILFITLPIAGVICSIIGLRKKGKYKWMGIVGLVLSGALFLFTAYSFILLFSSLY